MVHYWELLMLAPTVLIAELDPHTLDVLPDVLSDQIPHVVIDTCTTVNQLIRKLEGFTYDTVAVNPILLHTYRFLKGKDALQGHGPLIVTVSQKDLAVAHTAFTGNVFDLIVKPIVPRDAVQTVRLALWQNRLLGLLAPSGRVSVRFKKHMGVFPHALRSEAEHKSTEAAYERTFHTLRTSMRLLSNSEDKQSLFDLTASVESLTRTRALDRVLDLCQDGPSH
ncbi:MAG: hypothetical protein QM706_16025 [Nitrospira sp.]